MRLAPALFAPAAAHAPASDLCVVFGGTGDLSLRMLIPSLYYLEAEEKLPGDLRILCVGREPLERSGFLTRVRAALEARVGPEGPTELAWERLARRVDYLAADLTDDGWGEALARAAGAAERPLFYLATSPALYSVACAGLAAAGLAGGQARVVMEKPIGRDLESSQAINDAVGAVFAEDRTYRIDHYLGKETVQNLLALRFANILFEPLWNNRNIDHVQITVAESEGVGDRWRYYDAYGAARDMLQNHMLQLLALLAMEPPADMSPGAVRTEKLKVLRSLRRITGSDALETTVRGQYAAGSVDGAPVAAYVDERGGPSATETFVALRCDIDNWRWAGVPFFLRTGKRMPRRQTQVVVQFKQVPHSAFAGLSQTPLAANRLVIDLQPREDIQLLLMNKAPGLDTDGVELRPLPLSLSLANAFGDEGGRRRIAYERLLLDAMHGRQTLFVSRDEVEEAWAWVDGLAEAWNRAEAPPLPYPGGSWGPAQAEALTASAGRRWND